MRPALLFCQLFLVGCSSIGAVWGEAFPEYLDRFHAYITVHENASLTVCEEIDYVTSLHHKHGIVRDFPTTYEDASGNRTTVQFEIVSVKKDGKFVPCKTTPTKFGTRVFIGDPHSTLTPGMHHYTFTYDTNKQILFQNTVDELYWNVNGNWWVLPIKTVAATVVFPPFVPTNAIKTIAYTGSLRSREQDYIAEKKADGSITIASTRPFDQGEGLTISLTIPKGLLHQPSNFDSITFFVQHHPGLLLLFICFFAVLALYIVSWRRLRRSQQALVVPLFYPIDNLPPSAHRYVLRMSFDNLQMTADIVQLAVNGFLRIEQIATHGNARYRLIKTNPPKEHNQQPTKLQQEILNTLFGENTPEGTLLTLAPTAREKISAITGQMYAWLRANLNKNFIFHYRYLVVGLSSTLLIGIMALSTEPVSGASPITIALFILTLLLNLLAFFLHRIYTPEGCKLRDKINGFKLYLKTAESERINLVGTPPTKTPQLYEKYLPYAIALKAEKQWNAQFAPIFARLAQEQAAYVPLWFVGHRRHGLGPGFDPDLFVHDIASFSRSLNIPTQSSPTRVSSGMGGGGFSGGGRGGGGGGSW